MATQIKSNAMEVDEKATPKSAATAKIIPIADIKSSLQLLEKSIDTKEYRFTTRAMRNIPAIRKTLTETILGDALRLYLPKASESVSRSQLLKYLSVKKDDGMEIDQASSNASGIAVPETEIYLSVLVIVYLVDQKKFDVAAKASTEALARLRQLNRRTLDQISASIYYYHSLIFEKLNRLAEIRSVFLAAHRTATLRHDYHSQATLINCLLRNYLFYNLYDQADKFVSKIQFPEIAGNNQLARYMYYLGRIKAIQLDYTASHNLLLQAVRKAPQSNKAVGFQQAIHKLSLIVQLLMGEIPERSIFRKTVLKKSLVPYFHLTQAVRIGDLSKFQSTLGKYTDVFRADKTYTLIIRLRHNVIKTGIKMISVSYSKISLAAITKKVSLDSEEEAEYIVAKAIRDGVIDATIDHQGRFMKSKEILDIYSTNEPQSAFHQRTTFCLGIYNESVKALRFPESDHQKQLDNIREIELQEKGIVSDLNDFDDDDGMDF